MRIRLPLQPEPKQNDTKSVLRFAWLPVIVGNYRVWLERYEVLYMYEARQIVVVVDCKPMKFDTGRWTEVDRGIITDKPAKDGN